MEKLNMAARDAQARCEQHVLDRFARVILPRFPSSQPKRQHLS